MARNTDRSERMIRLWREGKNASEIGAWLGMEPKDVTECLNRLRDKLGANAVPYAKDISKAKANGRGKAIRVSEKQPVTNANKEAPLLTWARAFRVLAQRLKDIGDSRGYAIAQEIAKKKGVRL